MKFLRRKKSVSGAPDGKERRLPENARLRERFEDQKKLDTQQSLAATQRLNDDNARRINDLRQLKGVARLIEIQKEGGHQR